MSTRRHSLSLSLLRHFQHQRSVDARRNLIQNSRETIQKKLENSQNTGPKPDDLYDKFTWRIEGFSEVSKRELRSAVFEVGGYRW